jgi:hypothetical protein
MAMANATTKTWVDENRDVTRDRVTHHATVSGFKAGAATLAVTGPAAYIANMKWRAFRTRLNVSAKTALIVSPALAAFSFTSEKLLAIAVKDPKHYLAKIDGELAEQADVNSRLKLWQRAANYVYDHPYKTLVSVSVPLVSGVFAMQHANKNITVSQQIMTTRIYGQGAVVVLLLSSMAFHDYMSKRGRFEPDADEDEQQ